jgi:hypothetical protein
MFTINGTKNLAKVRVNWQEGWRDISRWVKYDSDGYLHEIKKRWDADDRAWVEQYIERMAKENDAEKWELIKAIDAAIGRWGEKKKEYEHFKSDYTNKLNDAENKLKTAVNQVEEKTKTDITRVDMSVQEKGVVEMLKKYNNNGANALLQLITEQEQHSETGPKKMKAMDLSELNIPSAFLTLVQLSKVANPVLRAEFDKSYRSNGAYGMTERYMVDKLIEVFNANKNDLQPTLVAMSSLYEAKMTPADAGVIERVDVWDRSKINTALANIPMISADARKVLEWQIGRLSDADLMARWNSLIALNEGSVTNISNFSDLQSQIKSPTQFAAYTRSMNMLAMEGKLTEFLDTGKYSVRPSNDRLKALETIDKSLQKAIKWNSGSALRAVDASDRSEPEKAALKKAITEEAQKYEDANTLRMMSTNISLVLTNQWAGIGGAISRDLDMIIADRVSFGWALATDGGKVGATASLMFAKNLYTGKESAVDFIYGATLAGSKPLLQAWLAGRYETWRFAGTGNVMGGNLSISKELGNNKDTATQILSIQESESHIATRITEALTAKKIEEIKMIDTGKPELDDRMNQRIRHLLSKGEYSLSHADGVKILALRTVLDSVLREEYARLRIEKVHTGWSLEQAGVVFGKFGAHLYVLPDLTFGKTDARIATSVRTVPAKTETITNSKDLTTLEATKLINENFIIGVPVVSSDGNSYSVTLEKKATSDMQISIKSEIKQSTAGSIVSLSSLTKWLNYEIKDNTLSVSLNDQTLTSWEKSADINPGAINSRNSPETRKALLDVRRDIYGLSRSRDTHKQFSAFLSAIENEQYDSARDILTNLPEKKDSLHTDVEYKTLKAIKKLSSNIQFTFQDVLTLKYTDVKWKRDQSVISAEESIPWATPTRGDSWLDKHTPNSTLLTQANSSLSGKRLSTYIYSTPRQAENNGNNSKKHHKMDRLDGPIMTHGMVEILGDTNKSSKQIILQREAWKSSFQEAYNDLSSRITAGISWIPTITKPEYNSLLLEGTVPERFKDKLTGDMKAIFYETRAAFDKSACLNKAEGIAYPNITVIGANWASKIPDNRFTWKWNEVTTINIPAREVIESTGFGSSDTRVGLAIGFVSIDTGFSTKPTTWSPGLSTTPTTGISYPSSGTSGTLFNAGTPVIPSSTINGTLFQPVNVISTATPLANQTVWSWVNRTFGQPSK